MCPFQNCPFSDVSFSYLSFSRFTLFRIYLFQIFPFQIFPFQNCIFSDLSLFQIAGGSVSVVRLFILSLSLSIYMFVANYRLIIYMLSICPHSSHDHPNYPNHSNRLNQSGSAEDGWRSGALAKRRRLGMICVEWFQ